MMPIARHRLASKGGVLIESGTTLGWVGLSLLRASFSTNHTTTQHCSSLQGADEADCTTQRRIKRGVLIERGTSLAWVGLSLQTCLHSVLFHPLVTV